MPKYKLPKIEDLLNAGVHFGHQVKRWDPNMEPYIYTVKKNIHIIDLEETERLLKEAADFLYKTARKGGKIIFVGTKKQAREIIQIEAKRSGSLYVNERWLGGTITNFSVIKKNNIDKLIELKRRRESGELAKYTKKERLMIDREIEKLERYVGGIESLNDLPVALFVVDARRERTAVREAISANIPVVVLIDTNTDPSDIDYIIPGNDDAIKSIAVIAKAVADAIEEGYQDYAKGMKEEESSSVKDKEDRKKDKPETKEEKKEEKTELPKKRGRPKKEVKGEPKKKGRPAAAKPKVGRPKKEDKK